MFKPVLQIANRKTESGHTKTKSTSARGGRTIATTTTTTVNALPVSSGGHITTTGTGTGARTQSGELPPVYPSNGTFSSTAPATAPTSTMTSSLTASSSSSLTFTPSTNTSSTMNRLQLAGFTGYSTSSSYGTPNSNTSSFTTTGSSSSLPLTRVELGKARPRGLVGLQNLGNTCFLNSCLQCVSNIPSVTQYFLSGMYTKEINDISPTKGALAKAFGDLIKSLWTGAEYTAARPVDLKRIIGKVASRFTGYDQQDAQEFLRFLLDGIHEDLNRIKKKPPYFEIKDHGGNVADKEISNEYWKSYTDRNASALSQQFCGQLRSEIRCHTCGHRSVCFDVFWDLSVPVPKKKTDAASVQDCLKAYTEEESLSEDDAYYCAKCKTHRAASKKISLYRLPQVLVVHLKRFSYSTFSRDKVNTAINFPAYGLNLVDYCASDAFTDGNSLYDLTGVVNHVGSLNGGHYTAECLNKDTNEWFDFNDATVTAIKKPHLSSSSAYILFFRRREQLTKT